MIDTETTDCTSIPGQHKYYGGVRMPHHNEPLPKAPNVKIDIGVILNSIINKDEVKESAPAKK